MDLAYAIMDEIAWTEKCIKENKEKRALLPEGYLLVYNDKGYLRWRHIFPDPNDIESNTSSKSHKSNKITTSKFDSTNPVKSKSNKNKRKKRIDGKTLEKNIIREDEKFAAALSEATILDALIDFDEEHLAYLKSFIENYHPDGRGELPFKYSDEYYRLAQTRNAVFFPDFQKELNDTYETSTYKINKKVVPTDAGIKVRSKSEASIVNTLYEYKIPFIYELIIIVKDSNGDEVQLAPDFIFIDPRTGKKWMWQHFGLMDKPEYAKKNLLTLAVLHEAGWVLGQNLIVTTGTRERPFTQTDARAHMKLYFPTIC